MKNVRKLLMVMLTGVLVTLAACGSTDEKSTKINNVSRNIDELQVDTEISEENENEGLDDAVADQTVAEKSKKQKNPSEPKGNIQITSGEEAVEYLRQHLKEGTKNDVSFGTDGKLETDNLGSYYTIQLVDIPLRASGKTGNLGYYKVYQDGAYELYQLNSSNNDSEMAKDDKEEYLEKLNNIEKEMDELQENSEATTTIDMEEEEAYRYKIWDAQLNEIYGILKEQLNDEKMDELREEQLNWIKHRDETAEKASLKYKGGSMESLEFIATQTTLTKDRCYELVEKYME